MTNKSVYGVKLNIANATHRGFKVLGSRDFEAKPKFIRAIKQKSSFKAMLYNDLTDEMEIFTQDLQKRDNSIPLNLGGDELIDIIQQPSSLVFHTKREIGFYRLNTDKISKSRCESKMVDIEQIVLESGVIFAKSRNSIQIFEAKFKSEECRIKGALRFDDIK